MKITSESQLREIYAPAAGRSKRKHFDHLNHRPTVVLKVKVNEVFLHCAKALMRSKLWQEQAKLDRALFPTMGQMLKDQLNDSGEPESQQDMLNRYRAIL